MLIIYHADNNIMLIIRRIKLIEGIDFIHNGGSRSQLNGGCAGFVF